MENFKTSFHRNFSHVAKYVENYVFKSIFPFLSKENFSFSTCVGKSQFSATLENCFQQPMLVFSAVGEDIILPKNVEFPIAFGDAINSNLRRRGGYYPPKKR